MNKMSIFKIFILLIIIFMLLCSCLGLEQTNPKIECYTLDYAATPMAGFGELSHIIKVRRFTVAPLYNTNRIIYQDQAFKRDAYIYHRWLVHPKDMISHLLTRDFQCSGLFKAVLPYDSPLSALYTLDGNVEEFLERDLDAEWEALLTIRIMLIHKDEKQNSDQILFQETYHKKSSCKRKHPAALVEAMSLNMFVVSREIVKDIYEYLKNHETMNQKSIQG
ncbi:MAG: membrane integrity-associated transporter subunit PqiC [Deltaproteobacteria bacterium]|nr:membrane integrity-associated transporter subunit PqiC [Deltaproteobacteria bacterium]